MSRPTYIGWNNRPPVIERIAADQRIWFISDLHIGDATPADAFFGKDRYLMALARRVEAAGEVLVIVGDAIDFHQAWSFTRVLRAHQELFSTLSRIARKGQLFYVIGNHDYEINLFHEILQFRVCDELHIGDQILCVHGWQYDPYLMDSIAHGHHWSTTIHHMVERYLGTWLRIPLGEFYTKGNRLMFWLAHKAAIVANGWARAMAAIGLPRTVENLNAYLDYWAQGNMGDSMAIFRPACQVLDESEWRFIVCGHSHLPGVVPVGDQGKAYVNTGSWTFASSQYVVWDGEGMVCRDWITGRAFREELYEPLISGVIYEKDFWQWWRENYMGFFRFREGEERRGRLRGWESYVRDSQHLSAIGPARVEALPTPPAPDQVTKAEHLAPVPSDVQETDEVA